MVSKVGTPQTMRLQTMSNVGRVPEEINVGRGDPVYMAHAYLTKVPVPAIMPFIEAYCPPGGIVADPFAGSGMTGAAAVAAGRGARLSDISVLGRHIGSNYLNLVDLEAFQAAASRVVQHAREAVGAVYTVPDADTGEPAELVKTVWSVLVECPECGTAVNYYRAFESAQWVKAKMTCPHCVAPVASRNPRVGEEPVVDFVRRADRKTQQEQAATPASDCQLEWDGVGFPSVEITPDREMYRASALGKSGMITVASFYSPRNLRVLAALHGAILNESDESLRNKLLFAFTATLTRASKRYQWSPQRPLNAANANYYVAPVFYEWNVFDLFERKVVAVQRSDEWIEKERAGVLRGKPFPPDVRYEIASADCLPYDDDSVDYVFTDPPFGSNLFYADMALFQEGWLNGFTDVTKEAVIDRSRGTSRSSDRYERLLTDALRECRRVLKPGGRVSMVFGNSSGAVWALVQRAVRNAGLAIEPAAIVILNKGQRSVKGLASGFEHVATLDLILTMVECEAQPDERAPEAGEVADLFTSLAEREHPTPSHLYLEALRYAIREGWSVADINLKSATAALEGAGWAIEAKTGRLHRPASALTVPSLNTGHRA
jgi:SAM-dependent methyltransferase